MGDQKDQKDLGDHLKRARRAVGISVADLADVLDISESYVRMVEQGVRVPSSTLMGSWANLLDIKVETSFVVRVDDAVYELNRTRARAVIEAPGRGKAGDLARSQSRAQGDLLEAILEVLIERLPPPVG